jgi:hypothetical protein
LGRADLDVLLVEEEFATLEAAAQVAAFQEFVELAQVDAVLATESGMHQLVMPDAAEDLRPLCARPSGSQRFHLTHHPCLLLPKHSLTILPQLRPKESIGRGERTIDVQRPMDELPAAIAVTIIAL